ncbi:glycosyltransferase [Weissella confusa]|uniref:glycosyltransferase n=1 Tax=Weissella confusa TaxID=1583 RepID=UPI00143679BD|nr:glycosyltransferase [Weissella confusa]
MTSAPLIAKSGLKNISFLGYSTNTSKALSEIDVFVSASRYEAMGLSIAEALEQGIPVIAMNVKYGPSMLVIDEVNGYLIGNTPEDLADAAMKFARLSEKGKEQMGERAAQYIAKNFSEDRFNQYWEEFLKN